MMRSDAWVPFAALALMGLAASPATAQGPYAAADGSWISIEGTIAEVRPDEFTLDYGDGFVLVEMDDGDRDADAYALLEGDSVAVSGRIDDEFFETTVIEASSVYVHNIGTTFRASAIDEEDPLMTMLPRLDVPRSVLEGTVSQVRDGEFVLDTGLRAVTVDVGRLANDPLDDEGYQKIEVGDRVRVNGRIDFSFFESNTMLADGLIEIVD